MPSITIPLTNATYNVLTGRLRNNTELRLYPGLTREQRDISIFSPGDEKRYAQFLQIGYATLGAPNISLVFQADRFGGNLRRSGQDLTEAWENSDSSLVWTVGNLSIDVPGPNYSGNARQDAGEVYIWSPPTVLHEAIKSFIISIRSASDTVRATGTLTIRDGRPKAEVRSHWSTGVPTPKANIESRVPDSEVRSHFETGVPAPKSTIESEVPVAEVRSHFETGVPLPDSRIDAVIPDSEVRSHFETGVPEPKSNIESAAPPVEVRSHFETGVPKPQSRVEAIILEAEVRSHFETGVPEPKSNVRTEAFVRSHFKTGVPLPDSRIDAVPPDSEVRSHFETGVPELRSSVSSPVAPGTYHESVAILDGDEPRFALEIKHEALTQPIRLVRDTVHHSIDGQDFIPLAFRAEIPQDIEHEVREATLEVDNVGEELMQWVEASHGGRGATVRMMKLLTEYPQDLAAIHSGTVLNSQISWEVTLDAGIADISNETVSIRLYDHEALERPGVKIRHDTTQSPGLF